MWQKTENYSITRVESQRASQSRLCYVYNPCQLESDIQEFWKENLLVSCYRNMNIFGVYLCCLTSISKATLVVVHPDKTVSMSPSSLIIEHQALSHDRDEFDL